MFILLYNGVPSKKKESGLIEIIPKKEITENKNNFWQAPDTAEWQGESNKQEISFGRQLIINTAFYFGPKGKIKKMSNGMNCQNCHLDAGTKIFGNNYSAVYSTYPKFRERSGSIESIGKRVNDCFERSLNGESLDSSSSELKAIIAYIKWLGKNVVQGKKPDGAGLKDLEYLDREAKCLRCHAAIGEGKINADGISYQYPPLWGEHSYNQGAGLFRLSRFAAYVKYNMPQGATFESPQLLDEEAWDVAAFVNSQSRPTMDLKKDWPKISGKPVDHPFGPYADKFSEHQHKYGPFNPIAEFKKSQSKKIKQ
jgi:thiosulfate dehydrogenase